MNRENIEEHSSNNVTSSDNESTNACPVENSRKRNMPSDLIKSDPDENCARKRHCNEYVDVPDKDTELPDIEVDQQLRDYNMDEGQEAIASQKNIKTLKDGMKRFFTFRSENASSSSIPGSSEYDIQNRSDQIEQLHLDVPNVKLNVVDELGRLENRGTESAELDNDNKAKNLLEKLRARKRDKEEATNDSNDLNSSPAGMTDSITHAESCDRASLTRGPVTHGALDDINKHVNSCRWVIDHLKAMFERTVELQDNPRVKAWRKELSEVEKKLDFPKTVIAVVGDTGDGKSSLMNAMLDHRILPTSGLQACTAVIVEVVENTASNEFIAEIQFVPEKEWFDELEILLNDLKDIKGTITDELPDRTSDAYVSYCKVKAVYGRVDNFNVLSRLTKVTDSLGTVKVIKSRNSEDFREQVDEYIETQEPTGGRGQYWPIVKHVTLKIPNCDVCSTGASLVDLPGVRDSNTARDKIAQEYLKNCTAVWMVASIHRAIDNKSAKNLLGENFRRQLLLDGQYGSIAFICTKTDVITPSEIKRSLKLGGKTAELDREIKSNESEKQELYCKIKRHTNEIQSLSTTLEDTRKEEEELSGNLHELKSLLDSGDGDASQSLAKEAIKEYDDELKEKKGEIVTMETRLESMEEKKQFLSQKVLELEVGLIAKRKKIASMCARARNNYSATEIRRDFKAGLKEMNCDIGSSAENLKVFCCSSTEYQKMKNLLTDDGPPQVFSDQSDTQIPELRSYVHKMTSIRRKQSLERLIRKLGTFVFDVQTYILQSSDTEIRNRQKIKTVIQSELEIFNKSLVPVMRHLVSEIDDVFDDIKQKVEEGSTYAMSKANDKCSKWGAPVNKRDKILDKRLRYTRLGGLPSSTYRATVKRLGVFISRLYGNIDFNEDLAEPIYDSLTIVWNRAFGTSGLVWKILDSIQTNILRQIKQHCSVIGNQLVQLGMPIDKINQVSAQLEGSASNKLKEMVGQLKDTVMNRQRDIARLITPHIQASLMEEYDSCSRMSGHGMFNKIKSCMLDGINKKKEYIFEDASTKLKLALTDLKDEMDQN